MTKPIEVPSGAYEVNGWEAEVSLTFGNEVMTARALFFEYDGRVTWFAVCQ